jgi:hypothetical protein
MSKYLLILLTGMLFVPIFLASTVKAQSQAPLTTIVIIAPTTYESGQPLLVALRCSNNTGTNFTDHALELGRTVQVGGSGESIPNAVSVNSAALVDQNNNAQSAVASQITSDKIRIGKGSANPINNGSETVYTVDVSINDNLVTTGSTISLSFSCIGVVSGSVGSGTIIYPDTPEVKEVSVNNLSSGEAIIWRFFGKRNGAHFYTVNTNERDQVLQLNNEWNFEGSKYVVFTERKEATVPVFRFWHKGLGSHLYTISENERNTIIINLNQTFQYEGPKFFVYPNNIPGTIPVHRFFNTRTGAHLYTISENERNTIINTLPYFDYEGIKYYVKGIST